MAIEDSHQPDILFELKHEMAVLHGLAPALHLAAMRIEGRANSRVCAFEGDGLLHVDGHFVNWKDREVMNFLLGDIRLTRHKYMQYQIISQSYIQQSHQSTPMSPLQTQTGQVPYRFVVLAVYWLASLVNSLPYQTFSSINSTVERIFQYDKIIVTINTLIFGIMYPIFSFPINWTLDKYGMRIGFLIGGVLVIAGVWCRTLMTVGNPAFCLLGSLFAAIGTIFIFNSPVKVAVMWFKPERAPAVIFLTVVTNLISLTAGASVPGLVISQTATPDDIIMLLRMQAIIVTIPFILLVIFIKNKPPIPPSRSAAIQQSKPEEKYSETLKKLFTNSQYLKLILSSGLANGTVIAFMATLEQLLNSLGYQNSKNLTSYTIISALGIGCLFSPLFSMAVQKTLAYKKIISYDIFSIVVFLGLLSVLFCIKIENVIIICIVAGLAGVFMMPCKPLFLSLGNEMTYPLPEASASGYMIAANQLIGFIGGVVYINLIDKHKVINTYIIFGLFVFSYFMGLVIFALFVKQNLKRSRQDQSDKEIINAQNEQINEQEEEKIRESLLTTQSKISVD